MRSAADVGVANEVTVAVTVAVAVVDAAVAGGR
jgi:hypothetical protein